VILPVVMKVKPTVPGAVIRFPSDPKRRVPDEGCPMPASGVDAEHFRRLPLTRELTVVVPAPAARAAPAPTEAAIEPATGEPEPVEPTGREPLTPITMR